MPSVAKNDLILKQRLNRFFFHHNNSGRKSVLRLISQFYPLGSVYLFGGAIRDIALQGIRKFYADLDFVIDCDPLKLKSLMLEISQQMPVHFNKFGGYRLQCEKWDIDIWPLSHTWAFTHHKIHFNDINSLLLTPILNWDAIAYNVKSQQLLYPIDYFSKLSHGELDLVLADNPNPLGAYIRVLRCIAHKPVIKITHALYEYLLEQHKIFDYSRVTNYELTHYRQSYLSQISIKRYNDFFTQNNDNGLLLNTLNASNLEMPI